MPTGHLVIDVGTSSLRACIVTSDATLEHERREVLLPTTPFNGAVEFDAEQMANVALRLATDVLTAHGPVHSVGITCQRASTVLWEVHSGQPLGPGIGWQDIRTAGMCLMWNAQGINLAPNQSATKLAFLLDVHDATRQRAMAGELRFGTVDTWIAWKLSGGTIHVTDASNAAVTGLCDIHPTQGVAWSKCRCDALAIPMELLPTIVDSSGPTGTLNQLIGTPELCGIAGDQQSSLLGQGCVTPGVAKMTFGTGGMLDMVLGSTPPAAAQRNASGTIPVVAWRIGATTCWGVEGIMLSAGTCVEWLRDDLGLIANAAESETIAASCTDTGGVVFVPALLGLATPVWDYGARGTLLGITRGTSRPEIVRAVLEGIAQRGADLVAAAQNDSAIPIRALRVDGGMSRNAVFVQSLADFTGLPVEVSPVLEATALGAGFLAGLATGTWADLDAVGSTWAPHRRVEPLTTDSDRHVARTRWIEALRRAGEWFPDLSALKF